MVKCCREQGAGERQSDWLHVKNPKGNLYLALNCIKTPKVQLISFWEMCTKAMFGCSGSFAEGCYQSKAAVKEALAWVEEK